MLQNIFVIREFCEQRSREHFRHPIAKIAFAHSRHRRVNCHHQRIEFRISRAFDSSFGNFAATH